jgi:hypothetical protein
MSPYLWVRSGVFRSWLTFLTRRQVLLVSTTPRAGPPCRSASKAAIVPLGCRSRICLKFVLIKDIPQLGARSFKHTAESRVEGRTLCHVSSVRIMFPLTANPLPARQ